MPFQIVCQPQQDHFKNCQPRLHRTKLRHIGDIPPVCTDYAFFIKLDLTPTVELPGNGLKIGRLTDTVTADYSCHHTGMKIGRYMIEHNMISEAHGDISCFQ